MARFDVYLWSGVDGYLLDCQADLLTGLNTRLVVPLLREGALPRPVKRLNPILRVRGEAVAMATQFAASVAVQELGPPVASLGGSQDEIVAALDMLISGF